MTDTARTLRVIVVDDEEPARMAVRASLDRIGGADSIAECRNGFDAVKAVTEHPPDVVLLDVQMPKLDGFEVLELIGRAVPVVFVTAYDQFALRAFEVHAVDYLLKPFSDDRLADALTRVRERLERPTAESAGPEPATLSAAARPPGQALDRVVIRDGAKVHVLPVDRIDYVEAQDDYVAFHAAGKALLKEQTLAALETRLDGRRFVRIHRSYLLNIDRLSRVELYAKDSRIAILADGTQLPVSRAGHQRLQQLL